MTDEMLAKAPVPKAYMAMALPVVMGMVLICTFQAAGKSLPSLFLSLCRQGIVYAVALAILPALFGLPGVLASQLAADVVTVVAAACIYRSSGIA